MKSIKTGQLVRIDNSRKAIVCFKCEYRSDYWGIIYMNSKTVDCIHKSLISPYIHQCWNCGTSLNSETDATCQICHWLKCPNCGTCRKGGCIKPDYLYSDEK